MAKLRQENSDYKVISRQLEDLKFFPPGFSTSWFQNSVAFRWSQDPSTVKIWFVCAPKWSRDRAWKILITNILHFIFKICLVVWVKYDKKQDLKTRFVNDLAWFWRRKRSFFMNFYRNLPSSEHLWWQNWDKKIRITR